MVSVWWRVAVQARYGEREGGREEGGREGGREGWREAAAALDVCICVCICVHTHTHTHTKHTHTHVTGLPCAPTAQKGAGKKLNAAVPNSTTKPAKFSQKKKVVYLVALQFV